MNSTQKFAVDATGDGKVLHGAEMEDHPVLAGDLLQSLGLCLPIPWVSRKKTPALASQSRQHFFIGRYPTDSTGLNSPGGNGLGKTGEKG
jgi:hypothetical protein